MTLIRSFGASKLAQSYRTTRKIVIFVLLLLFLPVICHAEVEDAVVFDSFYQHVQGIMRNVYASYEGTHYSIWGHRFLGSDVRWHKSMNTIEPNYTCSVQKTPESSYTGTLEVDTHSVFFRGTFNHKEEAINSSEKSEVVDHKYKFTLIYQNNEWVVLNASAYINNEWKDLNLEEIDIYTLLECDDKIRIRD